MPREDTSMNIWNSGYQQGVKETESNDMSSMSEDIKTRENKLYDRAYNAAYDEAYEQALEDVRNGIHVKLNNLRNINKVFEESIISHNLKPMTFNVDDALTILFHLEQDRINTSNEG
jgi:hypothetical protein